MSSVLRILAVLLLTCAIAGADTIREALVNLCDPAKTRVGKAIELDAKFKLLALDDADLEPLWEVLT